MSNKVMRDSYMFDRETVIRRLWILSAVISAFFAPLGVLIALGLFLFEYRHYEELEMDVLFCGIADIVFSIGLGAAFIAFTLTSDDPEIALIMFSYYAQAIPCGLIIILFYFLIRRKKNLCETCLMLIKKEHIVSLEMISDILGVDYNKTEKIINSLIRDKKLEEARIDEKTKELLFKKSLWAKQHVVCENCGAELVVDYGHTLLCEYCGSALRVRRIKTA